MREPLEADFQRAYDLLASEEAACIQWATERRMYGRSRTTLGDDQWSALIARHNSLLSRQMQILRMYSHPKAAPDSGQSFTQFDMLTRMWRHGCMDLLEPLRENLPDTRLHMLTFVQIGHSMFSELYSVAPSHVSTVTACLGYLDRYRSVHCPVLPSHCFFLSFNMKSAYDNSSSHQRHIYRVMFGY